MKIPTGGTPCSVGHKSKDVVLLMNTRPSLAAKNVTELLDLVWCDLAVRDVLAFPVVGVRDWRKRNDVLGLLVLRGKVFL